MPRKSNLVLPLLLEIEQERCKRSLFYYVQHVWPVVEPSRQFMNNWHIGYMCDYLQAVTRGEIRNLIINVPPGSMKSLLTGVFWPTWEWTFRPDTRWLTASYAEDLAIRDALKSRRIIQSPWYQERWGEAFCLSADQNTKHRYENDKTGYRISFGVSGLSTGERASHILVDDPLKAQNATSPVAKNSVISWWDGTMSTRDESDKTTRTVIMQRLAEDDLTGYILGQMEKGGPQYEHLCIPMEYEPNRYVSGIGLNDPRKEEGDLLWPERFPPEEVARIKFNLGEEAPGQLQQRPTAKGGAIFTKDTWDGKNRYDPEEISNYQDVVAWFLIYDTALKDEEQNDYTAHLVGGLTSDYKLLIRWAGQDKLQFPDLVRGIEDNTRYWQDGRLRAVVIEDKVSGTSAIQTLRRNARPEIAQLIQAFAPKGSKEYRARAASVWCSRNCVLLPNPSPQAPWLYELTEGPFGLYKFPRAQHDDLVDAFTMLILYCEYLLAEGWKLRVANQQRQGQPLTG
jgi:predicted phage terminase large subunit-like protein